MSPINVESTTDKPEAVAPAVETVVEETKSAPATKPEQKTASESDAEETEAKEESEESTEGDEHEEESKEEQKDKPKKKGGFQRRIDKLNARIAARDQELEYWKQLATKQKDAGAPEQKTEKVEAKPDPSGKPSADNFETHADYIEALTDWKMEMRDKSKAQEQEKSKLESEHKTRMESHFERVKSFAESTEDYAEVVDGADIQFSAAAVEVITSSELGPQMIYELAKDRKEAERIAKLSPIAAARELGKLEAKLSLKASEPEKKPEQKTITKAPKPIEPVGTGRTAVTKSLDDPGLSQKEYERLRRKQMQEAHG